LRRNTVLEATAQPGETNDWSKKIVVLGSLNYDVFLKM
jgi:hypothetical protein